MRTTPVDIKNPEIHLSENNLQYHALENPNQASNRGIFSPKWPSRIMVLTDNLPNAMLSFALVEEIFNESGWFKYIPASACAIGTYISLYNMFFPLVHKGLNDLKNLIAKCAGRMERINCNEKIAVLTILYTANVILTVNATYVFTGFKLEGFSSMANMFKDLANEKPESQRDDLITLKNIFLDPYFIWTVTVFNIPVTMLTYPSIHDHLLVDLPGQAWKQLQIFRSDTLQRAKNRRFLEHGLDQYIENIRTLDSNTIQVLHAQLCQETDENTNISPYLQFLSQHLVSDNESDHPLPTKQILSALSKSLGLALFFVSTYSMNGCAEVPAKSLGLSGINNEWIDLMSLGTRASTTAIFFETGYSTFEYIIKSLLTRDLGVRLDSNCERFRSILVGLIVGATVAATFVQSTLIGLELDNIDPLSFLGITYIGAAALGPMIACGAPSAQAMLASAHSRKSPDSDTYKLYQLDKKLKDIRQKVSTTEASIIENYKPFFPPLLKNSIEKPGNNNDASPLPHEEKKRWTRCIIL